MLFLVTWIWAVADRRIEDDGMVLLGFAAFCELGYELSIFAHWLVQ